MIFQHPVFADFKDDIGFTRLEQELGENLPDGASVYASQVEAKINEDWLPDPNDTQFTGKTLNDKTGSTTGTYSGHATSVGRLFYGTVSSLAPGIPTIDCYWTNVWFDNNFLYYGYAIQPLYYLNSPWYIASSPSQVANHSWVGNVNTDVNAGLLRRLDFIISADDFTQVVALNNGTTQKPLFGDAFNVIAVGRTDGNHPMGTTDIDTIYTPDRIRPHIVTPFTTTSSATPVAASAAALLIDMGNTVPALSTDPETTTTTNRSGTVIYNAARTEVIKAVIMAGASRVTDNTTAYNIPDYRTNADTRSDNGLDTRFGAGQLNIYNSYHILEAGEQNSIQDDASSNGNVTWYGFDCDPSFGGLNNANTEAFYFFTADQDHQRIYACLTWHLHVDGGSLNTFDGTATLYNLDLYLYDITDPENAIRVTSSQSTEENTENLWFSLIRNHSYRLQVQKADDQPDFEWDYALAWRIITPDDTDGDGMPDDWEVQHGLDLSDAGDADGDIDGDLLENNNEYLNGTNPNMNDTDGDGYQDGHETAYGSNPLDPESFPVSEPSALPSISSVKGYILIFLLLMGAGTRYAASSSITSALIFPESVIRWIFKSDR